MGAEALDDRLRAAVADREPHPGPADDVEPAGGGAEEADVPGDGRGRRIGDDLGLRPDDDGPARQALADVVVRLADEGQLDALGEERAEALAGGAAQVERERPVAGPVDLAALERPGQLGPERPVGGADREPLDGERIAAAEGRHQGVLGR